MSISHDDRWKELCERITQEPDSQKLMELVKLLNQTLEERENELNLQTSRAKIVFQPRIA